MDHVAGIAVRHPEMVAIGGPYGITIATCVDVEITAVAPAQLDPGGGGLIAEVLLGFLELDRTNWLNVAPWTAPVPSAREYLTLAASPPSAHPS